MSNYVLAGITGREVAGLWRAELYNETLSLGLIVQIRRISYTQVTTIKQFLCILMYCVHKLYLCLVCTLAQLYNKLADKYSVLSAAVSLLLLAASNVKGFDAIDSL